MNSGFQNRMYDYEAPPPAGVWNRIAVELDDSALANKFPATLQNIEVSPPSNAWKNIALAIDESLLVDDYSSRLAGLAVAPPTGVWNKIKNNLDNESVIAIPERRRIAPLIRYAVAAAIIGLIAWGGFTLFNNKSGDTPIAKENPVVSPTPETTPEIANVTPVENTDINDINTSIEEARNDAALEASKKTFANLDVRVAKSKIKNAADFYFVPEIDEPGTRGLGNWEPPIPKEDLSNRYFTLMTPEGNIIRISKKLSDIVGCVSGAEQDKECLDQLKIWQQKMANPKSTHSSANFMEILNLANSLQDKL
ncbi:MAG: hypothetical protein KBF82_10630 [Chitinophagaceae bacterium]|nr:hypothetical protein [Chitinophagaceae bacterium]